MGRELPPEPITMGRGDVQLDSNRDRQMVVGSWTRAATSQPVIFAVRLVSCMASPWSAWPRCDVCLDVVAPNNRIL